VSQSLLVDSISKLNITELYTSSIGYFSLKDACILYIVLTHSFPDLLLIRYKTLSPLLEDFHFFWKKVKEIIQDQDGGDSNKKAIGRNVRGG
jgi:hypothetical protein